MSISGVSSLSIVYSYSLYLWLLIILSDQDDLYLPTTYVKDNYKSKITSTSVTYIKSAMTYTVNNLRRNSSPKRIQIIPISYDKRILKKYLASIKHQLIQLCRLFLKAQFKYINSQIFYCIELSFVKDIDFDIFFPNG